jgi:hypothetical protein
MYYFWFYDEDDAELDCVMLTLADIENDFYVDLPLTDKDLEEIGYTLCEEVNDAVNFKWEFIED